MSRCDAPEVTLITYYGRSGSFFIHSLLDGHPQLIALPPFFSCYVNFLRKDKPDLSSADECFSYFLKRFAGIVDKQHPQFDNPLMCGGIALSNIDCALPFNISQFKTCFFKFYVQLNCAYPKDEEKLLFELIHYAYDACLHDHTDLNVSRAKRIVYQQHDPFYDNYLWFAEHFESVSILQMIREPVETLRANLISQFQHHPAALACGYMASLLRIALFNGTEFKAPNVDHFAVKLEDLHLHSENTMKALSHRLGVSYHPLLLNSTFMGSCWSNLKGREHKSGFNPNRVPDDVSDLFPDSQRKIFQCLMHNRYDAWGYQTNGKLYSQNEYLSIVNSAPLLVEYLPYYTNLDEAINAYERNKPLVRDSSIVTMLNYASHCQLDYIEVLL